MSIDDDLYSPILPERVEDKLRDIIKRVMTTPRSIDFTNTMTKEIVDLLKNHGFTDDHEIANIVKRVIKEMEP